MRQLINICLGATIILMYSCGGTTLPSNPVMEIQKEFASKDQKAYTILLQDMDLDGDQYLHKYVILKINNDATVEITVTDWKKVDDDFFFLHEQNLGMELLSVTPTGKTNNLVTPPGFTNFVGNEKFGFWRVDTTQTFWKFNSPELEEILGQEQIAIPVDTNETFWKFNSQKLEKNLSLENLKIPYKEYYEFNQKYLFNRPFYGVKTGAVGDSTRYGTRSRHWFIMRPIFYTRRGLKNNFTKRGTIFTKNGNRGGGGFGK